MKSVERNYYLNIRPFYTEKLVTNFLVLTSF
jgi:hypothetical protein